MVRAAAMQLAFRKCWVFCRRGGLETLGLPRIGIEVLPGNYHRLGPPRRLQDVPTRRLRRTGRAFQLFTTYNAPWRRPSTMIAAKRPSACHDLKSPS
jgi:hypothetical protein